jgi:7-cyano-7-deazaguanine synthase
MQHADRSAVVLLSGGLDSTVTLAQARAQRYHCHALTFNYGQRHLLELEAAKRTAKAGGALRHVVFDIDLRQFGGSSLTSDIPVPKHRSPAEIASGIPITYVPARNTVFLALAIAFAESVGSADIFIGVNAIDHSGYPDCRLEFIRAFERLANLATKSGAEGAKIQIHAPLVELTKAEIIKRGAQLGVDFALTHSCYDPSPDGFACGACDACQLRLRGFQEAGLFDPIKYAQK